MNGYVQLTAALTGALEELVDLVQPSLVVVQSRRMGAGAGVIWDREGLILTNAHVVRQAASGVLLADDREFEARLVKRDAEVDLALLQIEARDLPAIRTAGAPPRVGEVVFAFGHPWGQRGYVSSGIVSAVGEVQVRGRGGSLPILRTDVPLAPGNSGGPLVNGSGELLGINAMIVGGDQSLSIPVSVARDFVRRAVEARGSQSNGGKPPAEEVL